MVRSRTLLMSSLLCRITKMLYPDIPKLQRNRAVVERTKTTVTIQRSSFLQIDETASIEIPLYIMEHHPHTQQSSIYIFSHELYDTAILQFCKTYFCASNLNQIWHTIRRLSLFDVIKQSLPIVSIMAGQIAFIIFHYRHRDILDKPDLLMLHWSSTHST